MELIKPGTNFDFVGKIKKAVIVSIVVILIGMASLVINGGPNYGIDFAGGVLIQVQFKQDTGPSEIKEKLAALELGGLTVQTFGDEANEFLIRAQVEEENAQGEEDTLNKISNTVEQALQQAYGESNVDIRRVEMVGPQVGKDLRQKGIMAILYAMIGILIYVTWRFEFRYAVGAILALCHDVLVTLGAFSITGREIDLPIIAAFLAIIGYSLNDTIIIFDRVRENTGKVAKETFSELVNRSINETLSRTLLTSGTTLVVVLALFMLGGGVIHNFAFAMIIGIIVGTYSTIFVASAFVLYWDRRRTAAKSA